MKYVSILRGINVSGHKKIKMADLKDLYKSQGFESVTTYIQSGNIIFRSTSTDKTSLRKIIEKAIEEEYEFHVPVDIRTEQELKGILDDCPYEETKIEGNETKVLVTFLQSVPSDQKQKSLLEHVKGVKMFRR